MKRESLLKKIIEKRKTKENENNKLKIINPGKIKAMYT